MRTSSRPAILAAACLSTSLALAPAGSWAAPAAFLESATIGAAGSTVVITRAPVRNSAGKIVYKDIELKFSISSNGGLALAPGFPKVKNSPQILATGFTPGTYKIGSYTFTLSTPGTDGGGRTFWNFSGNSAKCPMSASWTTGPIEGHPQQARLETAKITFQGYSYGLGGGCFGYDWYSGTLIGAVGSADALTLYSYSYQGNTPDDRTPRDQVSFTRCQGAC